MPLDVARRLPALPRRPRFPRARDHGRGEVQVLRLRVQRPVRPLGGPQDRAVGGRHLQRDILADGGIEDARHDQR